MNQSKSPEDQHICLRLQLNAADKGLPDTDIVRILSENDLPVTVRVLETFHSPRSGLSLQKGSLLTFHFIRRPVRLYATDGKDDEFYLPLCARQLYQILPMNPLHDDKEYKGTTALIEESPLPERVRIVEAHFSDHTGEAQEVDDIIEIDRIEERSVPIDSDNPPQKCIIGRCNGVPVSFSESMDCATYSTMPSEDFLSLSEIVEKFPLPLRVRKADHRDFVMILLRKDTEYHVVATAANTRQILSIPVTWDGKLEILGNQNLDKLFRSLLPPIYPLVNTTWGLKEPGRYDLQLNMREVAQPLVEILDDWPRSKEGQDFALKTDESFTKLVKSNKIKIEELMEDNQELESRVKAYERLFSGNNNPTPPPSPRESPPARPPRPLSSFPYSPVAPTSPSALSTDACKDEDDYERPFLSRGNDSFRVQPPKQIRHLKEELQYKEQEIQSLTANVQSFQTENKKLDADNSMLLENIEKLQREIQQQTPSTYSSYSQYNVRRDISDYSVEDVIQLLREIKLEKYVENFKQNFIDGMLLMNLTENELCEEIGLRRIEAKRLIIDVGRRQNLNDR